MTEKQTKGTVMPLYKFMVFSNFGMASFEVYSFQMESSLQEHIQKKRQSSLKH